MTGRTCVLLAGILGAIGVALGAFGAHLLPSYLAGQPIDPADAQRRLDRFDTAVLYHMLHVLAVLAVGLSMPHALPRGSSLAVLAWIAGVLLFSGFLYAYALTGVRILGAVVPLGGIAFILGWLAIAWSASLRQN
jgi:uncharacterized membrane protein YgdD (TMEM256/DUF423 family)